mmetsp:Transcript_8113/g.5781  ORF Transcript_8113/g.5781 Transcript_8113/m.5781 type:complete len:103 (-) Transcript_8113:411-719(-)
MKIVVVGDTGVGKTALIMSYSIKDFTMSQLLKVSDRTKCVSRYMESTANLEIEDTSGLPEYAKIRPLSYGNCSCFLVCFAIDDRASFKSALSNWLEEIKLHG